MTKYELVDNFLPLDVFKELQSVLLPQYFGENNKRILWEYDPNIVATEIKSWKLFYMVHMIFARTIVSPLYDDIISHCSSLNIKALIRIKINMYPNTQNVQEHGMHSDFPFSHKAGILSINTCDGYTKLKDGIKIDSVANRMLLFDASIPHTSSTCTDQSVRMNINFNYF